jgi:cell division transport system permease protein
VQSAFHGLLASLIAMSLLMGLLYLIEREFFLMFSSGSTELLVLLGVSIMSTGILISIISTFFSVNRYLSISEDKLYY